MSDQEKDPVVHSSLSKQLFIWSFLLVLSLIWGLWDEIYGTRPWKNYPAKFQKAYFAYLLRAMGTADGDEARIKAESDHRRLDAAVRDAGAKHRARWTTTST